MLTFGRMDARQRWEGCETGVIEEARALLERALTGGTARGGDVFVDARQLVRGNGHAAARCRLQVETTGISSAASIAWAGRGGVKWDGACVRWVVVDPEERLVAGLIVRNERVYRLGDLCRALEASFDGATPRPGRFAVLDSHRIPPAVVGASITHELGRPLGAFHCDNPTCLARGRRVLLGLLPTEVFDHVAGRGNVAAFPCPSCPGGPAAAWALTFDEVVAPTSHAPHRDPYLRYPVRPPRRRVMPVAGPMSTVVGQAILPSWGVTWDPDDIVPLAPALSRCLEHPRLPIVVEAAQEGAWDSGLAGMILSPNNLRVLVEHCRQLPARDKRAGLALALARAYNPRRQAAFENVDDQGASAAERFHYIAFSPDAFLERLRFFELTEQTGRFLDVGCGIGEKPFLAYALARFEQCDGLEINARSLAVMDFLFASIATEMPYPVRAIEADALTFDRYGDYDVVYMYRPLRDTPRMGELVRQIAAQLRPGAIAFDVIDRALALRREEEGLYELDPESESVARWRGPVDLDAFLEARGLVA